MTTSELLRVDRWQRRWYLRRLGPATSSDLTSKWLGHLSATAVFLGVAVLWTFPLVRHLESYLLGQGIGDNVTSVWNFWWMRTALAGGVSPFYTSYLFAPVGVDLTLNTHTALPAFIGATALGAVPLVAAHNLTLLAMVVLNGCAAYALAWRFTRDHGAAIIAGLVFSGSPYMAAHLHGHFNLVSAWTMPLIAIAGFEVARGSLWWAGVGGLLLGITAYLDYYYLLYAFALLLCLVLFAAHDWRLVRVGSSRLTLGLARAAGALVVVTLAVIVTIVGTGGFTTQLGPLRISAHELFNPLQAFWVLILTAVALRLGIRIYAERRDEFEPARIGRAFMVMFASFMAAAAPLALKALELILRGDYVTQQYFWRSSPHGVDLATLVLGSPFHPVWGAGVQRMYGRVGIDVIESTAWLGVVPLALAAWVACCHWRSKLTATSASDSARARLVRQWVFIAAVFFVWALGPHLIVWGTNTGMILPQALIRYVPLVNNARIPGRAMVLVYLALAMLVAFAAAELRARWHHAGAWLVAIAVLIVGDYVPAPFPLVALNRPAVYETLRNRAEPGVVLELPLGIHDGFGVRGAFDERVLFYQTIHGRPLVGGFVARLSTNVAAAYEADPLIADLLTLSSGGAGTDVNREPPSADVVAASLRANGIRWIVVDRERTSSRLLEYVQPVLPLTPVARDGERWLYFVNPP
jgi:hypothetical protein